MNEDTRICSACDQSKPRDQFPSRGQQCRECLSAYGREYRRKNPDRMRDLEAQGYRRNLEKKKARSRAYYEANREAVLAQGRQRYQEMGPEPGFADRKEWRQANPDKCAEYARRYREKNPSIHAVINNNRRTRIDGRKVSLPELESLWTGMCALCGDPINRDLKWPDQMSKSVDHIIPLARGGLHELSNLQWAHVGCNRRKGDKIL
jgi:5-methylcytosine-specific restriction endonuclease McrA